MTSIPSLNDYSLQVKNQTTTNQQVVTKPIQAETKKIDKKKLAVGVAAGIGIAALVVGGLLYKHKVDSTKVKELAEHIDFKPAQTLDEAINFGKQSLGIHKYKGFQQADLDVVNWVNEGLVNVSNAAKGKAIMPRKIIYSSEIGGLAQMNGAGDMFISKSQIAAIKEYLTDFATKHNATDVLKKLQNSNNFKDWQNKFVKLVNRCPDYCKATGVCFDIYYSTFSPISHEMGHLQHQNNGKFKELYYQLKKDSEIKDLGETISDEGQKLRDLFKSKLDVVKSVSKYATESPDEFVAECYSKMIDEKLTGKTLLSQEARDLYQKLGGVMI